MGFFEDMSAGARRRENARQEKRMRRSGERVIAENRAKAEECLAIAEDALSNNDSRTAQKFAQEGSTAAYVAAHFQMDMLMGKW
ncbi:hypothetical protein P3H15_22805 [Rhodococcus sp. T2V]|uniref:hypothetical protein n=1 Tax=Rhodococcus sp. T2V TaxID=3034164 RepID=UPI0023E1C25A|nr:hypothetical protein [Rhodococcus sp. T2V]MDF3307857.1 hypothetical protein [Rhodococcus sp. T2V]